ncbi:uncharacterized protein N7483_005652 [Penicillium malachiteum]|uniref:uncharacterized protein n=1 Tax=Penicillium malachiteum TaxID=1324776 RepID=UPI0025477930|nr:uncharacterized protein N7483_005652 [Penicillium malachiteum]KAJ5731144.1 hypothetical protein N7483_005652 [Penicillium malachiteum]
MADETADWLQDKFLGGSGWPAPSWILLRSKLLMKRLGVKTAILSVTAPGACILDGQASFDLARKLNDYGAELRNKEPQTFGFFASLPSLLDTQAALAEIKYALDTLHADGVTVFTRYGTAALAEIKYALDTLHADGVTVFTRYGTGNVYLGHPSLEPIWAELYCRKCVVFVHPTHPVDTTPVNELLPQPAIDYPHETTRAAMDMIIRGTRRKFPDSTPMRKAPDFAVIHRMSTTHARVMEDLRSFYYELALSASPSVLDLALKMIPHDHILYGSDFPYALITAYPAFLEDLENYEMGTELRDKVNFGNAQHLIPRLQNNSKYEDHEARR